MVALSISMGISSGLDTLCPQAIGAQQYRLAGYYLNRARVILIITFIIIFFPIFYIDKLLIAINQNEEVSIIAGEFSKGLLPGVLFFFLVDAERR